MRRKPTLDREREAVAGGDLDMLGDPCDLAHGARVAALAEALASRLRWTDRRRARVRVGAALHDLGKLAIPRTLLGKPGPLTDEELVEVRRHPSAGAWLVYLVTQLRPALPCVLYHHERWDGQGYPRGLADTDIPLEARLLAVADAFDAMISDRPYRQALSAATALEELDRGAGSQFDPWLAEAFIDAWWAGVFKGVDGVRAPTPPVPTASPRPRASRAFA